MSLIESAVKEISALDVDAVVLSHWDLDHILGVCYNSKCLQKKIWIVPDFEKMYDKPRVSMKRLCNYLLKIGNSRILMVDTTDSNKVLFQSVNDAVTIYMGDPVCSEKINKMNNGGLLMKLQNNKNILMPGDCENKIIPKEAVCKPYDYVVIPHHGSYMSMPRFFGKKNKKNTAYLCCGEHPGHCSYNNNIKKVYKGKRFSCVRNTKDLKKHNKYKITL